MDKEMEGGDFHSSNNSQQTPPGKIIGVLGIGIITGSLVKKLVESGHTVNIWSQSRLDCDSLHAELGQDEFEGRLKTLLSARAVLKNSDIIFNLLSDHNVSKRIIRNDFGIHNASDNIFQDKGFIEMTPVDPEASKEIKEMIESLGGKYLEAQVQNSWLDGEIMVLAAGDKLLFEDCYSCFQAIGFATHYGEVGRASIIHLILQQIKGVCLGAFAEGLAVADSCEIEHNDFLEICSITGIFSPYLLDHADNIASQNFTTLHKTLSNMQRDLNLVLDVSKGVDQPMFLASLMSEILKRCQSSGIEDHDASAIHQLL